MKVYLFYFRLSSHDFAFKYYPSGSLKTTLIPVIIPVHDFARAYLNVSWESIILPIPIWYVRNLCFIKNFLIKLQTAHASGSKLSKGFIILIEHIDSLIWVWTICTDLFVRMFGKKVRIFLGLRLIFMILFEGPGADWDNLESEQRMGRPVGQLEGWQVHWATDRHHGNTVCDHLQEVEQVQQRTQGNLVLKAGGDELILRCQQKKVLWWCHNVRSDFKFSGC